MSLGYTGLLNYTLQTMMPSPGWPAIAPNAYDNNNNWASLQRIKYDMSGNRWRLNANKKTDAIGSVVSHAWMTVDYQSKQYSGKQILQSESQDRSARIQCTKIWMEFVLSRKKYNSFFSKTERWCRSMAQRVLHTSQVRSRKMMNSLHITGNTSLTPDSKTEHSCIRKSILFHQIYGTFTTIPFLAHSVLSHRHVFIKFSAQYLQQVP